MAGTKPRLRVSMHLADIGWDSVRSSLLEEAGMTGAMATALVRDFLRKLTSPINVHWLGNKSLSREEQKVVLTLCELYGADVLNVALERTFTVPLLEIRYRGEIAFDPFARDERGEGRTGTASGRYEIALPGVTIRVNSLFHAAALYAALSVVGVLLYVVLAGMLLYSVAVFLLFIADPELMTIAAVNHPSIGLALLCLLVGLAGLGGKAFRNVATLVRERISKSRVLA